MTKRRSVPGVGDEVRAPSARHVAARHPQSQPGALPIARSADGVVEATCCVAVVTVPLYFSLLSPLGPETDKAVILIALALIAACAWLVGQIDRIVTGSADRSNFLLWSGLAFFAVYVVATLASIHPSVSLYGTFSRHQGLLTHASYFVFFVCVATRMRSRDGVQRLLGVMIFASIPAVVYGVIQQFGVDPAPTVGDISTTQWPVRSSFGQHIFFAAYLVMLIPCTAARLLETWELRMRPVAQGTGDESLVGILLLLLAPGAFLGVLALGKNHTALFALLPALLAGIALLAVAFDALPNTRSMISVRMGTYAGLLVLQVLALIFTSARGPWLGFFATLPVFGLLAARRLERPLVARAILLAAAVLALFVGVLNIDGGPLQSLRTKHTFNRIANIQGYVNESSGAGRLLIWNGVETLLTAHPAIGGTWGGPLRTLIGYGPESLDNAFETVFPLKLRVETSEIYTWDRAHSIYFDIVVDAGVLALLALLVVLGAFFRRVLRTRPGSDDTVGWLAIAAVSAVVGHLVEGIFGVETAASLLIFWVILGLGASPHIHEDDQAPAYESAPMSLRPVLTFWAVSIALIVLIGLAGLFDAYPGVLMFFWTVSIMVGIGVVAWLLMPRRLPSQTVSARGKRSSAHLAPLAPRPHRASTIAAVAASVLALLGLASQWNYETAAITQAVGFNKLTHSQVTDGLADLEAAARMEDGQPKYMENLSTVYSGIASANPQSSESSYIPQGNDFRTIDPQRVVLLGRSQLLQLARLSLLSAQALTPLDPTVYSALGDLYTIWNKLDAAIGQYRHAELLSRDNPRYIDEEALARLHQGRTATAGTLAASALRLDPTFWYSLYVTAKIDHRLQRHAQARAAATSGLYLTRNASPLPTSAQRSELTALAHSG